MNDIIRGTSNLEWYMLRPPCRNCAELIIKNRSFYKNLTIFTAACFRSDGADDYLDNPFNRILELKKNNVKLKAMSSYDYFHYTKYRLGHKLPGLPLYYSSGKLLENNF